MTELEILAGFKQSYFYLEDIIENADGIQIEDKSYINIAMELIAKEYRQMYRKIKEDNQESLHYKNELYVADSIYYDYITTEIEFTEFLSYADLENEEKWWEDYDFLTK